MYSVATFELGKSSDEKIFDTVFKELHRDGDHVQEISPNRKNINRRLGDVLNSFEAIGMILKGRNIVKWIGYPNYDKEEEEAEKKTLTDEKQKLEKCIQEKMKNLETLISQYISFKRLLHMKRNLVKDQQQGIVNLPFIVIRTDKNTNVECSVSSDEFQYIFTFDCPFEILDNMEVLQKMYENKE
ncbi:transcription factor Dp-1 [Exaiptasia diaphana]|uniref:Transcription factor DP C-terminal domain-containing protein n=1 Tax=Exaiptasia diaphana TaxID=2652724 RepID=A0A913YSI7_EXADI|nr:transcription factor Dp-1 [Exaiptasia diaphana]